MTTMLLVRWILAALLGLLAVFLDTTNIVVPLAARKRGQHTSAVPLVGAFAGGAACLICPIPGSEKFVPVALLLDVTVLGLIVVLVTTIAKRRIR